MQPVQQPVQQRRVTRRKHHAWRSSLPVSDRVNWQQLGKAGACATGMCCQVLPSLVSETAGPSKSARANAPKHLHRLNQNFGTKCRIQAAFRYKQHAALHAAPCHVPARGATPPSCKVHLRHAWRIRNHSPLSRLPRAPMAPIRSLMAYDRPAEQHAPLSNDDCLRGPPPSGRAASPSR
jgi:hypothetical protein